MTAPPKRGLGVKFPCLMLPKCLQKHTCTWWNVHDITIRADIYFVCIIIQEVFQNIFLLLPLSYLSRYFITLVVQQDGKAKTNDSIKIAYREAGFINVGCHCILQVMPNTVTLFLAIAEQSFCTSVWLDFVVGYVYQKSVFFWQLLEATARACAR